MPKLVAALLMALLTSLACVEGIACPDGCPDDVPEQSSSAPASADAECMSCRHAVFPAASVVVLPSAEPVRRFGLRSRESEGWSCVDAPLTPRHGAGVPGRDG